MVEAETIARGLTKAQRGVCINSEPGAFGRADDGCGAELVNAGQVSAARALMRKGLGDIEDHSPYRPRFLYFNNSEGLAVRRHLLEGADNDE